MLLPATCLPGNWISLQELPCLCCQSLLLFLQYCSRFYATVETAATIDSKGKAALAKKFSWCTVLSHTPLCHGRRSGTNLVMRLLEFSSEKIPTFHSYFRSYLSIFILIQFSFWSVLHTHTHTHTYTHGQVLTHCHSPRSCFDLLVLHQWIHQCYFCEQEQKWLAFSVW